MQFITFTIQCTFDIATGLRHRGSGRYSQRGRYLCNDRAPSFIGDEAAIVGRYIQGRYIEWALYSSPFCGYQSELTRQEILDEAAIFPLFTGKQVD